jgi:hypothetical protein
MFRRPNLHAAVLVSALVTACSEAQEAKRVTLPVTTDGAGLEVVTNDLGYTIEVASAAVVAEDVKFAIAGEAHTGLLRRLSDAVVPLAHAHPGHYQGGEVTGEMPGHFVMRFAPGSSALLGTATLLAGQYHSVNITLSHATAEDVPADDPLLEHSAILLGTASRDGVETHFRASIDSPAARDIVGIPFDANVDAGERALALRMLTLDPLQQDTLFDGLDFALLDADEDGEVSIGPEATDADTVAAYNQLRRTLQTHDHFVVVQEPL